MPEIDTSLGKLPVPSLPTIGSGTIFFAMVPEAYNAFRPDAWPEWSNGWWIACTALVIGLGRYIVRAFERRPMFGPKDARDTQQAE